jgi:NAD(P)-dependent dehydrogenase (short-subunit alcohol dehydrogenase family)
VNNAGVLLNEKTTSIEGYDKMFVTNTLSNFILTENFIPLLKNSKDPRVINVSSGFY